MSKSKKGRRGRSYVAPERVGVGCTSWPGWRDVVACVGVCKSWRETMKEPGPRDAPIQCFIRRDKTSSIYRLYLGLSPDLSSDACKLLLVAKKVKRTIRTYFLISLVPDDFSRTSDKYMGRIRSNIFGTKFSMYDSQPRCKSAPESIGCFRENSNSEKLSNRYPVAAITYELNLLRSRGPRRMLCTMDTIPVAAIREGGNVPTPDTFSSGPHGKLKTQAATSGRTQSLSGNENSRTPLVLKNQAPRWHEQLRCWCLNFNGRVTVASVKNFQLVAVFDSLQDEPNTKTDRVVLQFGKIGKDA
ncbi:hypothetical protein Leryth_011447 [Lithospermum erythrorhizon]|nr:hypothetical protein Leryth_011447 [Lithospermum erythrorhizon]